MPILDHIDFAVSDLARSRAFYTQALAPLGITLLKEIKRDGREGVGFGANGAAQFWIGGGETVKGRLHFAFAARTRAAVDAFHRAAIAAGGRDHGGPGLRPLYGDTYYAAYIIDPDGHVIEAVCQREE
jgi:catechol 2,3-dioxygenase-like lactoylglutathione lyase family enzyme